MTDSLEDGEETFDFEETFRYPFANTLFTFTNVIVDENCVKFEYEHAHVGGQVLATFQPVYGLHGIGPRLAGLRKEGQGDDVAQALLALGIAVLSYVWMGFLTPVILIRRSALEAVGAPPLTVEQITFWREVFLHGLRELFFVNGIGSFDGRGTLADLQFRCEGDPVPESCGTLQQKQRGRGGRVLVPMGAGKDSTIAWELLKCASSEGCDCCWYFLEGVKDEFVRSWRYRALAETSGARADEVLIGSIEFPSSVERARNKNLELTGHLWAAMVCFASSLTALAHGFDYVAVGNERSAGLGNGLHWQGVEVNHQWDKSYAFERPADDYLAVYLHGRVRYFSVLTPLWDLQVALLFARRCEKYLPIIISCNDPQGAGHTRWCGRCAKCAFVVAILQAFLPVRDVRAIFGDDLFETTEITAHLDSLADLGPEAARDDPRFMSSREEYTEVKGIPAAARGSPHLAGDRMKPLECVGGSEETRLALRLVAKRYAQEGRAIPRYFTAARRAALEQLSSDREFDMLRDWGEEHLLPNWLAGKVSDCLQEAVAALVPATAT